MILPVLLFAPLLLELVLVVAFAMEPGFASAQKPRVHPCSQVLTWILVEVSLHQQAW
jgi:hypothetical protein